MKKISISLLLSSLVIAALLNYKAFITEEKKSTYTKGKVIVKEVPLQKTSMEKSIMPVNNNKSEGKNHIVKI